MDAKALLKLARSLPEAAQSSHAGASDIRLRGKIFAQPPGKPVGQALIKLTREQQTMMCSAEPDVFIPEAGHWGRAGWTRLAFELADDATVRSALWAAWCYVAPKTLAAAHGSVALK